MNNTTETIMLQCIGCKRELPAEPTYFFKFKHSKTGFEAKCKECRGYSFKEPRKKAKRGYKICPNCKEEKPLSREYFHKCKRSKSSFVSKCKSCVDDYQKEYRKKNRDKLIVKNRSNYYKHQERRILDKRRYYQENKETIKFKRKIYYRKNREYINKWSQDYRNKNKEKINKKMKEYFSSPKGKLAIKRASSVRRSRVKSLPSTLTTEDWLESLDFFKHSCSYCGCSNEDLQQEHVIAVSKGGYSTRQNIIPACGTCNNSKKDKDLHDWYPNQPYFSEKRLKKILKWSGINDKTKSQQLSIL